MDYFSLLVVNIVIRWLLKVLENVFYDLLINSYLRTLIFGKNFVFLQKREL